MANEELRALVESLSDEELAQLSPEEQDEIIRKLEQPDGLLPVPMGPSPETLAAQEAASFGSGFNLGNVRSGVTNALSGLGHAITSVPDKLQEMASPGSFREGANQVVRAVLSPRESLQTAGESVASVVPGGRTAFELATTDQSYSPKQIGEMLAGEVGGYGLGVGLGGAAGVVGSVARKARIAFPSEAMNMARKAKEPMAVAAQYGYPRTGMLPREMVLAEEIAEAGPTMYKYKLPEGIDTSMSREALDAYTERVNATLNGLDFQRKAILNKVDSTADRLGIPKISLDDIPLDKLKAQIGERDISAFKVISSETAEDINEMVRGSFEQSFIGPNGQTWTVRTPRSANELKTILDSVYDELRVAKAFDKSFEASGIADPSILKKNADTLNALQSVADGLRRKLNNYVDEVSKVGGLGIPSGRYNELGADYHALRPLQDAGRRFEAMTGSGLATPSPTSLVQSGKVPTTRTDAIKSGFNSVFEQRRQANVLNRSGELVRGLQEVMAYRYGNKPDPLPRDYFSIKKSPRTMIVAGSLLSDLGLTREPGELEKLPEPQANMLLQQASQIVPDFFQASPYTSLMGGRLGDVFEQSMHMQDAVRNAPLGVQASVVSGLNDGGKFIPITTPEAPPPSRVQFQPNIGLDTMVQALDMEQNAAGTFEQVSPPTETDEMVKKMQATSGAWASGY